MKSFRLAAVVAVTVSTAVLLVTLSGCSKKASASTASGTGATSGQNARGNFGNMEQRVKDGLSELVSAGTITQAQADKIQTALTQNLGQRMQNASGAGAPSGSGSRPQWNGSGPSGSGEPNGSGRGERQSQLLDSLVSDGTITQEQANAVIQKLFSFNRGSQSGDQSVSSQS